MGKGKAFRVAKRMIRKQYRPIKKMARKAERKRRSEQIAANYAANKERLGDSMPRPTPIQSTINFNAIRDSLNL
jgi:hypothetical protein